MPKPRTRAREQRRLARQVATADAIAALDELAAADRPNIPPAALPAYRQAINRYRKWLARAHCSPPAPADPPGAGWSIRDGD